MASRAIIYSMKLYLLRHGKADWPNWNEKDDLRPLTENGKADLERAATFFKNIRVMPDVIFSSPLPRAQQTAAIVHEQIGGELKVAEELSPGFALPQLRVLCKDETHNVMLVGHEPDLSAIIRQLCGAHVKMGKATLALLDFNESGQGRLIWLLPTKISAR